MAQRRSVMKLGSGTAMAELDAVLFTNFLRQKS
jgi:hypothetical protein